MSEQSPLPIGRFSRNPLEAESSSTELADAVAGARQRTAPKITKLRTNRRSTGRLAGRIVKLCVVPLLLALMMMAAPATSSAQVAFTISVSYGPPALPVYAQPLCPGPGYIWVPGYWAWDPVYGYYWVPGTWVLAPFVGALWTPGYWAWDNAMYVWYPGYWGPVVGFYGGIVYGYGYTGYGYDGGYWRNGAFYYNRAVNHINVANVRNVYYRRVALRRSYVSYNGGPGGIRARPSAAQMAALRERRSGAVDAQTRQQSLARRDRNQRAAVNRGRPPIAATARPGTFMTRETVRATRAGAPYKAQPPRGAPGAAPRGRTTPQPKEARPPQTRQPRQPRQPSTRSEQRPQSQQRPKEVRPPTGRQPQTARPKAGRPEPVPHAEPGRQGKPSRPSQPPKKPDGTKGKGKPEGPHH